MMLNGWPQQLDVVVATHGTTPLAERLPKVMWRGRAEDEPRDEVRRALVIFYFSLCKVLQRKLSTTLLKCVEDSTERMPGATGQTSCGNE
jgi:hypothetical protein